MARTSRLTAGPVLCAVGCFVTGRLVRAAHPKRDYEWSPWGGHLRAQVTQQEIHGFHGQSNRLGKELMFIAFIFCDSAHSG